MVIKTQLAGRVRARGRAAGHRQDRAQAAGSRRTSTGCAATRSRANRWCSSRSRTRRRAAQVPETWYQVRKKIGDIRNTLPPGIQGPFFNDEFGDTYANIYALTGDGFDYASSRTSPTASAPSCCACPASPRSTSSASRTRRSSSSSRTPSSRTLGIEPADDRADARGAERGGGGRHLRHGDRPHLRAPHRRVRFARRDPRHRDPRQRPRVPPGRHRERLAAATSIRRSSTCAVRATRRSASASRWRRAAT